MAHDKVYGICENKCAVEVYPKDKDGWITCLSAESYPSYTISEAIQYRRIGGVVFVRGALSALTIPANVKSKTVFTIKFPDGYDPTIRDSKITNVESLSDGRLLFTQLVANADGTINVNLIVSEASSFAYVGCTAKLDMSYLAE